ncbi:MAG TPA: restriction system-associated AAA family ATPase [Puia sp.]|jgi:restriction system-associated AAA family ATPase|nr:restriction system-associated AAA family ATPase [Puia sp.]
MKLHYFKLITPFRGLPKNFEIDFTRPASIDPVEPICLVGLNGSGKSNLMQALAQIFYYLCCINHPRARHYPAVTQDQRFILQYELLVTPANILAAESDSMLRKPTLRLIRIRREVEGQPPILEYKYDPAPYEEWKTLPVSLIDIILPRYIIGYSSGQNELLSNPFVQMDFLYYQNMRETLKGELRQDINRMFFMDYQINAMALIVNYINRGVEGLSEVTGVTDLPRGAVDTLDATLGIDDIRSFSITMNLKVRVERSMEEIDAWVQKTRSEGVASLSADFFQRYVELPSDMLGFVQNLIKVSTTLQDVVEQTPTGRRIRLLMYFRMDGEMRRAFQDTFRGTVRDVFQSFYFLNLLNINLYGDAMQENVLNSRYKVSINGFLPKYSTEEKVFHIDDIKLKKKGVEIDYKNLSDGEHQFMHVAGTLMLLDEPGTLFLLDEPETHFNPEWRSLFIKTLNEIASRDRSPQGQLKDNKEIIMTTHSPFILSDCRKDSIFIFRRGKDGKVGFDQPKFNTYGASADLLLQEIFSKSSSISRMTEQKIDDLKEKPVTSEEEVQAIRRGAAELGDSVEKFMLLAKLNKASAALNKASATLNKASAKLNKKSKKPKKD